MLSAFPVSSHETSSTTLNFEDHSPHLWVMKLSHTVVNNFAQVTELGSDGARIQIPRFEVKIFVTTSKQMIMVQTQDLPAAALQLLLSKRLVDLTCRCTEDKDFTFLIPWTMAKQTICPLPDFFFF